MRLLLLLGLFILASCSQLDKQRPPVQKVASPPKAPALPPEVQLQQAADAALKRGDLIQATKLLTQRWSLVNNARQARIEQQLYQAWQQADSSMLEQGASDPFSQPWSLLIELERTQEPEALAKTLTLYPDALFSHHLSYQLHASSPTLHKIAIFLPLSGRFEQFGKAVRAGMIKKLLQQHPPLELFFYDSAQVDHIQEAYQHAVSQGAETIVGPIQKDAISRLAEISQLPALFLNEASAEAGWFFPFNTPSEAAQIVGKLHQIKVERVGVFYKQSGKSAQLQATIDALWHESGKRITAQYYSGNTRDIRRAFDQLMNINKSKQRKGNLRYLLQHPLDFEPRPREDLQAIVLLANQQEAAIINPMRKFYGLKITLIGSSLMMPLQFTPHPALHRDLAGVRFPAFPALLTPHTLSSPLEAWGWDAITLIQALPLPSNTCMQGQTGQLQQAGKHLTRTLKWLKYRTDGNLTQWNAP